MKLLKPTWVSHDGKPIFSIDIHPAGRRFATGGHGGDSGRVVVWNLSPVLDEAAEVDPNVPKMLCQMDNHLACVNSVRWSTGGRYLASGGDDKLVMVWGLSGGGKHNVETWRCVSTLRGHAGDVLDLAWSPRDRWLASCSVDNTIIVWNADKFPEMVSVLNGHSGLVKGIAWDPVGKYLASQSDDKSLRVWKTADWTQEAAITEPFEECGGTTHVLRLSWSPDGQYVLSAHAMNGGGPTAQVVERDGWRCDKDFVGHRKAVTCTRFNNNILVKEGKKYCCAAVGSRDRALSIWLTSLKRPLVVVQQLFTDSVLDLSWSSDGLNLLACSWDGSVACVQFTNKEVGVPLTLEEKNAIYERTYGKSLANEAAESCSLLVECPEILRAREKVEKLEQEKQSVQKTPPAPPSCPPAPPSPPAPATPARPVDRQIETRTSDGKRRITPVFIPITTADANESIGNGGDGCFSSSSASKSRIVVERRDIVTHPNVSNHAASGAAGAGGATSFAGAVQAANDINALDSRLKKRAHPSPPGPRTDDVYKKRRPASPPASPAAPAAPAPAPADSSHSVLPTPALGMAGPVVRYAGKYRVQVLNNSVSTPHGQLTRLQLLPANSTSSDAVWETLLGSSVNCIACDASHVCVTCADGSAHAWAVGGGGGRAARCLPPLALGAPAARLLLQGHQLVTLTTGGALAVWDLRAGACGLRPASLRGLLQHGVTVTSISLLEDGSPHVTLSNGRSYVHCPRLLTWIVWSDATDPLWRACRGAAVCRAPLASLSLAPPHKPHPLTSFTSGYGAEAAASWLEAQLSAARQLARPLDYKHWLLALATHLAQHGSEERLRWLCDDLLGPSHGTSRSTKWEAEILGLSKHGLLTEVLSVLVKQLRWQRLYSEYADQLPPAAPAATLANGH